MKKPLLLLPALAVLGLPGPASGEEKATHKHYEASPDAEKPGPSGELAPRLQNLGKHRFPVTTKSAQAQAFVFLGDDRLHAKKSVGEWDVAALLKVMWDSWNDVFRRVLGPAERSLLSELRDHRNRWAHQEPFSSDDTERTLDSAARLLTAISATQADEVARMKAELRRVIFDEQVRSERRKAGGSLIEAAAI